MKIAIMGAGLSGLACALTLEQNGVVPHIFERRGQVGERFVNGEILLSILTRPITDQIAYLSEEHHLYLNPVASINKLIIYSQQNKAVIEGKLGFSNLRGRDDNSFERQLARQVKSKIHFNSKYTYEGLLREFTHVIMATGDAAYAARIKNFRIDTAVTLRGANVSGKFGRYTVMAWLNNHFAPMGYSYLIPISEKVANIVIAFPEGRLRPGEKTATLWERFFLEVCHKLDQNLQILSEFEINNYLIGTCGQARIGNTFFVGNNFGSIMPFLGFGQFNSMQSGIFAAYDLCGLGNYQELVNPLKKSYSNSLSLRRTLERLSNRSFDLLVRELAGTPGRLLFHLPKPDLLKLAASLLKTLPLNNKSSESGPGQSEAKKPGDNGPQTESPPLEYQISEPPRS